MIKTTFALITLLTVSCVISAQEIKGDAVLSAENTKTVAAARPSWGSLKGMFSAAIRFDGLFRMRRPGRYSGMYMTKAGQMGPAFLEESQTAVVPGGSNGPQGGDGSPYGQSYVYSEKIALKGVGEFRYVDFVNNDLGVRASRLDGQPETGLALHRLVVRQTADGHLVFHYPNADIYGYFK